jgi:hypothetical protein
VDLDPSASGAWPVVNVSWVDAIDVCNRISDRTGPVRTGPGRAYSLDAQSGEVTCDWARTVS